MHIEDQVGAKRCGHRPGKELVSKEEMVDRIKAAVDARTDPDFFVMARTDALAVEGFDRCSSARWPASRPAPTCIFPEAITDLAMYRKFVDAVKVPVLANITEFGKTPLFTLDELRGAGDRHRALSAVGLPRDEHAALNVYEALRSDGTQKASVAGHADARRSLRLPRLPRLRAEARRTLREGQVRHRQ